VLEDVGDTGPALGLVEEPRFDVGDDRDDGGRFIGLNQEGQTVGKELLANAGRPDRRSVKRER
jgi:hypothetical protein